MAREKKEKTVEAEVITEKTVEEVDTEKVVETEAKEEKVETKEEKTEVKKKKAEVKEAEVSPQIEEIMRLYPQYEEMWITKEGFVHPVGAPEYLLKNASLYKNKFYNK